MTRLYYEYPDAVQVSDLDGKESKLNRYLEKVAKLVPSEIIAGYLAMVGFVPQIGIPEIHQTIFYVIFFLCLVLTPVYLNRQSQKGKPKKIHLIVSTLAFIIWAYVTTGNTLIPDYYDAALGSIALIAFSLISGVIPLTK